MTKEELVLSLVAAQKAAVALARETPTPENIAASKDAGLAIAGAIVEGASVCPGCGLAPHGLLQPVNNDIMAFEIGCLKCRHHRTRGGSCAMAVASWNQGCVSFTGGERFSWDGAALLTKVTGWMTPKAP